MVALGMHVHDVVAALGIVRAADTVTTLPKSIDAWLLVAVICAAMLVAMIAMLIYGWQGTGGEGGRANNSVVRSWIAVSLIAGLLILTAAALGGTNQGLQNILVGGVIAATGSAIAFYFATKSAENANAAVLKAAGAQNQKGAPISPLLLSKTVEPAQLSAPADGTAVTYSFKVTNNGTVALTGVHVSDTLAPPPPNSYKWPGAAGLLRPGEAVTATSQRTITPADATNGAVTSIATASGMPPTGPAVHSEPETTTVLIGAPHRQDAAADETA